MSERSRFKERKRPARPGEAAAEEEAAQREAQRRRWELDEEEGHPEDLGAMLLKLGRRMLAQQLHVVRLVKEGQRSVRRELLVRSLGSEERYRDLTERSEESRAQAREHFSKGLAFSVDRLSTYLEMQRGQIDYLFGRMKEHIEAQDRMARMIDRLAGLGEDDIHQATVKSIVLYRLVTEMMSSDDPLLEKLSPEERRRLFEFALGLRKEMPDVLAALFRDNAPPPRPCRAGPDPDELGEVTAIGVVTLTPPTERGEHEERTGTQRTISTRASFALTSEAFEDRRLVIYPGPCIALKDRGWDAAAPGPWPDDRFHARLEFECEGKSWSTDEEPPVLAMLESTVIDVSVQWNEWFQKHHKRLLDLKVDGQRRRYRIPIHIPAAGKVLLLDVIVDWSRPEGQPGA